MGIWIRAQNKKSLINAQSVHVVQVIDKITKKESTAIIEETSTKTILLGEYPTEERAIEVLDYIHRFIQNGTTEAHEISSGCGWTKVEKYGTVYEIPTE